MRKNLLIIYHVNDYYDAGGGNYFERFETEKEMDARADRLLNDERTSIEFSGEIKREYEYKPKEKVVSYERIEV